MTALTYGGSVSVALVIIGSALFLLLVLPGILDTKIGDLLLGLLVFGGLPAGAPWCPYLVDFMTPDPRPEKRRKASTKQWARIREQFRDQSCQVCGKPWESLHHLVPRGQSGDDVYANLAPLCGDGVAGCHGLVEARENGARGRLAASLTHVQRVYILNKKGAGWLERNYPEWRDAVT